MDGDLEAQDLGCLAVIARVQDGDDLADDIAEHGVMILLAGIPQLIEIRGHVIKAIEIDAGTHIARMRLDLDLASGLILIGDNHAELRCPVPPGQKIVQLHGHEGMIEINAVNALLAQLRFEMSQIIDDAAKVLLKVIPGCFLHEDIILADVFQRADAARRKVTDMILPIENTPDLFLLP